MIYNPTLFIGELVTSGTAGAPLIADTNGQLASGILTSEATATADATTTSATDVLMTTMTLTPAAGTYAVWASCSVRCSANGGIVISTIYSGGSAVAHTARRTIPFIQGVVVGNTTTDQVLAQQTMSVTVNGSQAIELRWKTSAGTATVHERTLSIMRIA